MWKFPRTTYGSDTRSLILKESVFSSAHLYSSFPAEINTLLVAGGGSVEVELAKRGVSADPSWVTIQENQSVSEAVNELIAKHPNLNTTTTPDAPEAPETRVIKPRAPAAIQAGPTNSNVPPNPMASRSVDEVKKDPKARSQLRDHYRSLIRRESNQSEEY